MAMRENQMRMMDLLQAERSARIAAEEKNQSVSSSPAEIPPSQEPVSEEQSQTD